MSREEAQAEAMRRNADPAGTGLWAAQERDGEWRVVHLTAPGLERMRPTGAHVESRPKPPEPADPRPAIFRDVPPYGAG